MSGRGRFDWVIAVGNPVFVLPVGFESIGDLVADLVPGCSQIMGGETYDISVIQSCPF